MSRRGPETYEVYYNPRGYLVAERVPELNYLAAHIHTNQSDGWMSPEQAVDEAINARADAVAITDHDNIKSSEIAMKYVSNNGLDSEIIVVSGAEISSRDGHVLAIGINGNIEPGQSVDNTIVQIHQRGGVGILAHPQLAHTPSVSADMVRTLVSHPNELAHPDGTEIFNASAEALHRLTKFLRRVPLVTQLGFPIDANNNARTLHRDTNYEGAAFGGADAHGNRLDRVLTVYRGDDPVQAIREGRTAVVFNPAGFGPLSNASETLFMARSVPISRMSSRMSASRAG